MVRRVCDAFNNDVMCFCFTWFGGGSLGSVDGRTGKRHRCFAKDSLLHLTDFGNGAPKSIGLWGGEIVYVPIYQAQLGAVMGRTYSFLDSLIHQFMLQKNTFLGPQSINK